MSVKWISRIWENAPVGGRTLLVLLALADSAGCDGDAAAVASLEYLARRARITTDETATIIGELARHDLIRRDLENPDMYHIQEP